MFREPGKDHGHMVTGMPVAGTGNDDTAAMHFTVVAGRLQRNGHFGPIRKGLGTAEFNPLLMKHYGIGGEAKPGLSRLNGNVM